MEERLPLQHNHLVLPSLMTQSPNRTLCGRDNTRYQKTSGSETAQHKAGSAPAERLFL